MSPLLPLLAAVLVQAPQASVGGVVREADSGRPIEGATVVLGDVGRATSSASDGRYLLERVPSGPQHLEVSALGHETRVVHALVPASGTLAVDVTLAVEPIELAEVVVRPSTRVSELAGARAGATDREVPLAGIDRLPSLGEADALRALGGGPVSMDPEAPSGLHVRGGAADHTAYELDGLPVFDPVHAAGLFGAWSPDALSDVSLSSAAPSAGAFDALSGVVSGRVRDPGPRFASEATLATTHGSVTVHGPIADGRVGYVASARTGFIGTLAPRGERSYLRGESGDGLVKVAADLLGGSLGLLVYSADNELAGASAAMSPESTGENRFEWASGTVGGVWTRTSGDAAVQLKGWRASSTAAATWSPESGAVRLDARRVEIGAQATGEASLGRFRQRGGVRVTRIETAYDVGVASRGELTLPTVFAESAAPVARAFEARLGASATPALGRMYLSPRGQLAWSPGRAFTMTLALARTHQFTQSLANPESVVRHVFPAGLSAVAGSRGIPVPTATQAVLGVSWAPGASVALAAETYVRSVRDLALVAPLERGPFASASPEVGSASIRGAALQASQSGARFSWLAGYGWQRVHVASPSAVYTPSYGVAHVLDAGVGIFPTGTLALRFAVSAGWGRSATDQTAFEWESCNLLDLGCELAGSPMLDGPLGGRRLPPYLRVDVGARKHWHLRLMGRESLFELFGTVTNVLGRRNELLWAAGTAVDMRPLSPLVLGADWRF